MRIRGRWTALLLAAVGCGSGTGTTPEQFLNELAAAACQRTVACGTAPDLATCEASQHITSSPWAVTLLAAVDRGTAAFDAAKAQECLNFVRSHQCNVGTDQPDACYGYFEGRVAAGGACVTHEECAAHGICNGLENCTDSCCTGTCSDSERYLAPVGAACREGFYPACARNAYCQAGTCVERIAVGGACTMFEDCLPPAICDFAAGRPRTCVVPATTGGACDPALVYPCRDIAETCDEVARVCVTRKGLGEPCATTANCVEWATCRGGTCESTLAGQPCDEIVYDYCYGDLFCESSVCTTPPPATACTPT